MSGRRRGSSATARMERRAWTRSLPSPSRGRGRETRRESIFKLERHGVLRDRAGMRTAAPGVDLSRLALPEERRRRLLARPELLHRLGFPDLAVLDDPADLHRVVDVVERIRVEDHEVGELAGLDRAEVRREADLVGGRGSSRRGAPPSASSPRPSSGRPRPPSPRAPSAARGPGAGRARRARRCRRRAAPRAAPVRDGREVVLGRARSTGGAAPCASMTSCGTKRLSFGSSCGFAVCQ